MRGAARQAGSGGGARHEEGLNATPGWGPKPCRAARPTSNGLHTRERERNGNHGDCFLSEREDGLQDFAASIVNGGSGMRSLNVTSYETEVRAYGVTQAVLQEAGEQHSLGQCGSGGCILGADVSDPNSVIDQLLANPDNNYNAVTRDRPGSRLFPERP
jgi:hypothetical protein